MFKISQIGFLLLVFFGMVLPLFAEPDRRPIAITELKDIIYFNETGSSKLFSATWNDRKVVLKYFKVSELEEKNMERELGVSQRVENPFIVKIHGVLSGKSRGIVMDYYANGSLYDRINDEEFHYGPGDIRQWMTQMIEGLIYLKSLDILHRDLKSLNVLMTEERQVVLTDFGLARVLKPGDRGTGGRGTVQWMSPEMLQHEHYDHKTDIYSLGIILWELCFRKVPYNGVFSRDSDAYAIAGKVVINDLRPAIPEQYDSKLSPFIEMMRLCWDKDPNKRPEYEELLERFKKLSF